jgi:uncharacterized protein YdcH (DUF465 family)
MKAHEQVTILNTRIAELNEENQKFERAIKVDVKSEIALLKKEKVKDKDRIQNLMKENKRMEG